MSIFLALGGAKCVWEDLEAAQRLLGCRPYRIGAVNDMLGRCPQDLYLGASLHPEKVSIWLNRRGSEGFNLDFPVACHKGSQGYEPDVLHPDAYGGSSGLYLVSAAVSLFGFRKVICCGMPITKTPHFFDEEDWGEADKYRKGWLRAMKTNPFKDAVRSMSGWTSEVCRTPVGFWLDS